LKIGQRLPKLWTIKYQVVFFMKHGVFLTLAATLVEQIPSLNGHYHGHAFQLFHP